MAISRVSFTPIAADLINRLRAIHGDLLFHQSGGCCDGSAPMCYTRGEFKIGQRDVYLGELQAAPSISAGPSSNTGSTPTLSSTLFPAAAPASPSKRPRECGS